MKLYLTLKNAYDSLKAYMVHHDDKKQIPKVSPLIAAAAFVVMSLHSTGIAKADQYDAQIRQKQSEQNQLQAQADALGVKAQGIQGEIEVLQAQIAQIQVQIAANTAKQQELIKQIDEAQKKLEEQKALLSANIRAMYIDGDMSPLEMVASSKNLGDFIDKQEYRTRIKDNISKTLDEIERLKKQLNTQKQEVERIIREQQTLASQLNQKQGEAASRLAATNQEKAGFDAGVAQKASEIANLQAQQRAANARYFGAVGSGPTCGGGYPGRWCNAPKDSLVDSWGMYNRECVSYTAFKVAASGRRMPYWGGRGNANQWPSSARTDGIPTGSTPKAGAVAISMIGYYGHAMYVEKVSGNMIYISEYNLNVDGRYSERWTSAAGLTYIYF